MADAILVSERLAAGEWLVRAADAAAVPLRAAIWSYDPTTERWTLALEAQPSPRLGPRDFSAALHAAAAAIGDPAQRGEVLDLLLTDVALYTQPHPLAERLRPSLGRAASVARAKLSNAVLYRLEAGQPV